MVNAERETLLLRGTLDMCVLALIAREPQHAYSVVQYLQERGFPQVGYGTIYPLITRLRRQGLLLEDVQPGAGRPARKVLRIAEGGEAALVAWQQQWKDHTAKVTALLGSGDRTKGTIDV